MRSVTVFRVLVGPRPKAKQSANNPVLVYPRRVRNCDHGRIVQEVRSHGDPGHCQFPPPVATHTPAFLPLAVFRVRPESTTMPPVTSSTLLGR